MMSTKNRVIALLFSVAVIIFLTAGCQVKKPISSSGSETTTTSLPIVKNKITLTWWYPIAPDGLQSWSDSDVFQEMEKRTNIHIDFQIPSGDAAQQYSLMIASGNLPDIVTHDWFGYAGGPDAAVADNVYIDLTSIVNKYMPNYKKAIDASKVMPFIQSPSGKITWIAGIRTPGLQRQPPYAGPIVRQDWLDKLGLDTPVTIDDWYNMLKAFKTQLNVQRPLLLSAKGYDWNYPFMNAYGITDGYTVENGKVIYGPTDDRMLSFVTEMNKWVNEGLLVLGSEDDKDYYDNTTGSWNNGFYLLDSWKSKASDPNYHAVGVPYPVLKAGDVINVTSRDDSASTYGRGTFITTANKYPVETAKYFDYFYSPAGNTLQLYGVEGQTYSMVNGKPQFNDQMLHNKDKTFLEMIKSETFPTFVNDWRIELAGFSKDEVDAETNQWAAVKDANTLPDLENMATPEQYSEYQTLFAQINAYTSSEITGFINGKVPLSNWQAYVAQVQTMGLDQMTSITQSEYNKLMSVKK